MNRSVPFSQSFVHNDSVVYGQLIVLGTNGQLPGGDRGRRKSCFTLKSKSKPSGVKPSATHQVLPRANSSHSEAFSSKELHSASYTLPQQVVVVPYVPDAATDMFQIGRSTEPQIDFVLMDIFPGASLQSNHTDRPPQQSTISRFACRIVCDRMPPYTARIFAAGFDSSMNITLGEKAPKLVTIRNGKQTIDGLTTNGVLLMQPRNGFTYTSDTSSHWKEVSVCGEIYSLRELRSAQNPGTKIESDNNILVNGTLINLGGTTLLWRSCNHQSSGDMLTPRHIDQLIFRVNQERPQCPVGHVTIVFPKRSSELRETEKQPWVFLECGHVHSKIYGVFQEVEERVCPMCRSVGKFVPLWIGNEPAFYLDAGLLTHCFVPCGHVCSLTTAKYWSCTALPHGTQAYDAACPFCATPLEGDPGFQKLIWQPPVS